jgi:PHP family Zn ribbon phosphoesterase
VWTPYFGVFGSMSGFDSLKEAFGKEIENVHSIETGISSNPEMNWKIKELDNKAIVSFSDSHSFWPWRLGREATIFYKTDSYFELVEQIRKKTFFGTIETDPAYGKYHWDGHASCGFSCSPEESKNLNEICPICKKILTIGVESRVIDLGENPRRENFVLENGKFFYSILPLHEIISMYNKTKVNSKKVWEFI